MLFVNDQKSCFLQFTSQGKLRTTSSKWKVTFMAPNHVLYSEDSQWCGVFKIFDLTKNQSIFNIIRWVTGLMGQTTRRPSVWCSQYYLFFIISCKILCKNLFKFFFYNFTKKIKMSVLSKEGCNRLGDLQWTQPR